MIISLQTLIFFRESILATLDRLLSPYYRKFSLTFIGSGNGSDDEDTEEQVFAEYDDEKGVVFYPPMYAQRYATVSDCLMDERWRGKLEKVVDLGYHDMSFIKYLKEVPGIKCILGVDIESIPLRCSSDLLACSDYAPKRESPLQITLFQGNAADPDFRLIGCDAVIGIEMIEHMLPHDLDRLVHTVFGFIKPWIVIFTTPNGDFNVLFKSLEKNGLRRWDHFFEWSREQFNDWSSNIVIRYPSYTVSCQGIGPGPPGTEHLGCCSQLALFVAKDYNKQQDLSLDSLALVAKVPSPNKLCDMIGSWDSSIDLIPDNNQLSPDNFDSYPDLHFSEKDSGVFITITSTSSLETLQYRDGASQCNLDFETAKGYLMFDNEQMCFDVLVPRRKVDQRVYDIEDVSSRLNCTTLQATKFSKTTQKLMAKNKIDSIVHTREVVDEIRHLTKMLNFNKDSPNQTDEEHAWSNINWGDNAPYWNQYYNVVREYNYPFETKSVDCRILDLLSDEINRLIDAKYEEIFVDASKLEIPIQQLMRVVEHITDDVHKVKELLEWNGYEVVDDVVIHSRLVDSTSVASREDDWQDNDIYSDAIPERQTPGRYLGDGEVKPRGRSLADSAMWDTNDVLSTSLSDGSAMIPDMNGRLRRALDLKVRKLRTMLSANEDITSELDRVVCRLMKLSLRTSKDRETPPPSRWMQCKLLDMLTLTEKAIERRQRYFIENYPLKKLEFDEHMRVSNILALDKIKADNTANVIVDKYQHLVERLEDKDTEKSIAPDSYYSDLDIKDLKTSTELLKDVMRQSPPIIMQNETDYEVNLLENGKDTKLQRTQAWVEEDIEVVPYPNHDIKYENSSGDTDHSTSNAFRHKYKKNIKRRKIVSVLKKSDPELHKMQYDKYDKTKPEEKKSDKSKSSKTKISKKVCRKKSSNNYLFKNSTKGVSVEYGYGVRNKRRKDYGRLKPTVSKPIPETLKELCQPELIIEKDTAQFPSAKTKDIEIDIIIPPSNVAAIEKSFFIDIVMDDMEETIALRRSVGTDPEDSILDSETIIRSVSAVNVYRYCDEHDNTCENVQSQTIFLYDINEPTTSKGIRHANMDVQCGPDVTEPTYSVLSTTTSLAKMPNIFTTGFNIGDEVRLNQSEFGTSTNDSDAIYKTITPRVKTTGIRIKDSDTHLSYDVAYSTVTRMISESQMTSFNVEDFSSVTETELLKTVSSGLRIEDSGSEACRSLVNFGNYSKNTSDIQSESSVRKVGVVEKISATKSGRSRLSCGGVFVHSYRDKDISEDIVYQGEWQRYRSDPFIQRKPYIPLVIKKVTVTESVNKKLRVQSIKTTPELNNVKKQDLSPKRAILKNPTQLSNTRHTKIKQENRHKSDENKKKPIAPIKFPSSTIQINKPNKNVSKIATKLTSRTSSKNINSTFPVKKNTIFVSITSNKNNDKLEQPGKLNGKNYLPHYLRRNKFLSPIRNRYVLKRNTAVEVKNEKKSTDQPPLEIYKSEEISTDLLKFRKELCKNVNYFVFRNELENKNSTSEDETAGTRNNAMGANSTIRPPYNFQSQTSSTCSSPNSIATVRDVTTRSKISSNKRYTAQLNKNNLTSESENSTSNKNKKLYKRCQSAKRSDKNYDNKENIPESSGKGSKSAFMGRHKRFLMAKLAKDSSPLQSAINSVSKHKAHVSNKSNIKIPTVDNTGQIKITSPTISKQRSRKSNLSTTADDSNYIESKSLSNNYNNNSNLVLVVEQLQAEMVVSEIHKESIILTSALESSSASGNSLLAHWIENKNVSDSRTSNISTSMRQLIEETLEFIDAFDNLTIDHESIIRSHEDIKNPSLNIISAPTSNKTVIPNEEEYDYIESSNEIEQALNCTFDTTSGDESIFSSTAMDQKIITNDLDLISFKSLGTASKVSEYFLADSEINNFQVLALDSRAPSPKSTSVKDIFERKDQFLSQNPGGTFANQAFSGFSIDGEPLAGDQLDHVNLIDSETGSMAVEVTRQATSEELFISGRSSGSYESCLIDEDVVVPFWLFQVISQQQSIDDELEDPPEAPLPIALAFPMPMVEPIFDENGNMMDGGGVTVGAGAGDGRGIHSDHSHDSSGRGTSLSSSDMSSGPQSQAILIDPSAFAAQFELLREPGGGSRMVPTQPTVFQPTGVRNENETLSSSRADHIRNPRLLQMAASDADISSTDTDVPDSSSN